jgi:hypothetical protein
MSIMTDPDLDPDLERNLAELFDRSAAAPSEAERTRLLARARNIGKQSGAGVMTRLVWAPALAAAAAVAYLVAAPPGGKPSARVPAGDRAATESLATGSASTPAGASAAFESAPSTEVGAPATAEPEDPLAAVLGGDDGELEPFDLGPLMGGGPRANDEGAAGMDEKHPWSHRKSERSPE